MPGASRVSLRTPFRIRYALMALGGALLFGTVGFHLIEGWSLADSLYLTVQTLTTVGYGDLTPRNGTGRLFAVVVMLMGVGGVGLAISAIVQSVVQSELVATFGQRRRSRRMSKLYDHLLFVARAAWAHILCGTWCAPSNRSW